VGLSGDPRLVTVAAAVLRVGGRGWGWVTQGPRCPECLRRVACGGSARVVVDVVQALSGVVPGLHNIGIGGCGERRFRVF
jgi:hypothetical protein